MLDINDLWKRAERAERALRRERKARADRGILLDHTKTTLAEQEAETRLSTLVDVLVQASGLTRSEIRSIIGARIDQARGLSSVG